MHVRTNCVNEWKKKKQPLTLKTKLEKMKDKYRMIIEN